MNDKTKNIISLTIVFILIGVYCISVIPHLKEIIQENKQRRQIYTEITPLASLDYTTNLEGSFHSSFMIGRGYIDTVDYYVAYEILEDDGKRLIKFPANDTIIYDTLENNEQAYAEIDKNYYKIKAIRLYVPKNTITQEYNLTLDYFSKKNTF